MNWDQIEGNWKQLTGKARANWGEITDDEWLKTKGQREEMIGLVQERYGETRAEAERQIDAWTRSL